MKFSTSIHRMPSVRRTSRGTDPSRLVRPSATVRAEVCRDEIVLAAAAKRQRAQLPNFAPLLEELELAGWSSRRNTLTGNFHDWVVLDDGRILMTVGQSLGPDPTESAWITQSVWSTIRAHALHTTNAGTLLSLAARSLWSDLPGCQSTSVAVALLNTSGGHASIALAGDCLAWQIRASSCEAIPGNAPPLGVTADSTYRSHEIDLSLRERLVLAASDSSDSTIKTESTIAARFKQVKSEAHRKMSAADALSIVQEQYERKASVSSSIVVARRR